MTNHWQTEIDRAIDSLFPQMVALRRHLHAHPEPSGEELQTSLYLYQRASDQGLRVRMGPEGRGVVVEGRDEGATRRIALRADIDALRIHDQKGVDYHSQVDGIMHACGHDAHTAVIFGTMMCLDQLQASGQLPWPVAWRAIFQPSEETATGAREMVAAGALEGVDAILSAHVDPSRRTGTIGVRPGVFTANCDDVRITVHGRGGHAARPHESIDPIAAAAQLISTLYQFIPRATDSQDAVVIAIGHIHGGENANVIPEKVALEGTFRSLDRAVRARTMQHIGTLATGIEQVSGTKIEVRFESSIPSVYNDERLTSLVTQVAEEVVGAEGLKLLPRPSMGSEDFAVYLEHVPGTMFRLGCAPDEKPAPGLHTPIFDVAESCLAVGAKILARAVVAWSNPNAADNTWAVPTIAVRHS
jgi:amidohydrolase